MITDPRIARMLLYAWIGADETGDFGVKTIHIPHVNMITNAVAAKERLMLYPGVIQQMEGISKKLGQPTRLAQFSYEKILREINL